MRTTPTSQPPMTHHGRRTTNLPHRANIVPASQRPPASRRGHTSPPRTSSERIRADPMVRAQRPLSRYTATNGRVWTKQRKHGPSPPHDVGTSPTVRYGRCTWTACRLGDRYAGDHDRTERAIEFGRLVHAGRCDDIHRLRDRARIH